MGNRPEQRAIPRVGEKTLLNHTFIHIPGIGRKTEKRLWERGIMTWEHYLQQKESIFSAPRHQVVREALTVSMVQRKNLQFFVERLPGSELWRLFPEFRHKALYLDIETSVGLQGFDGITVIGAYDGRTVRTFVNGVNLEDFEIFVAQYEMMVTFNGTCFDLPYIRRCFRHISLPSAHIDLRFLLQRLGYRGGLKRIENRLGIVRDPAIQEMNGYDAVLLWRAHQWGEPDALERLIQYNTADIVNLKPLMEMGYREMRSKLLGDAEKLSSGRHATHPLNAPH